MRDIERQGVVIHMPRELHDAIKARAAEEERSMAATIRHALRVYLDSGQKGSKAS